VSGRVETDGMFGDDDILRIKINIKTLPSAFRSLIHSFIPCRPHSRAEKRRIVCIYIYTVECVCSLPDIYTQHSEGYATRPLPSTTPPPPSTIRFLAALTHIYYILDGSARWLDRE